ncbi:MAG: tRNA-dihydrouridine synthase, partial [Acholeplasmatales bacterium]|nr:tRNA-dihydrouridine synthase [Acholeplasmatales bacterium]
HYHLLLELKGEHLAMLEMRSHVAWYLKGMPGSARVKDECNHHTNFDEVLAILREYLNIQY